MSLPPAVSKFYPSIPDPGGDPSSFLPTIQALKAALEILTRQANPKMYSAVLWQELVDAGLISADGGNGSAVQSAQSAWTTGDCKITYKAVADAGWIMANDGSIGDASSNATTRAGADTVALFMLLWNNIPSLVVQDSTGATVTRGADAPTDFAAHRRLVIPKMLGRSLAVAGAGAGLTSRVLGTTAGAETETPTTSNMAAHFHTLGGYLTNDAGHAPLTFNNPFTAGSVFGIASAQTDSSGTGNALNILDPSTYVNCMIKL